MLKLGDCLALHYPPTHPDPAEVSLCLTGSSWHCSYREQVERGEQVYLTSEPGATRPYGGADHETDHAHACYSHGHGLYDSCFCSQP